MNSLDLFGHHGKAETSNYDNRGTLSGIGDDAEYLVARLTDFKMTTSRERSRYGFPDLVERTAIHPGAYTFIDVKSGVGYPAKTERGNGNVKFVIYASQTAMEDVVRGHFQRSDFMHEPDYTHPSMFPSAQKGSIDIPVEFRGYYAFVKRVSEKGYLVKKPMDALHFCYQNIYLVRNSLVKAFWAIKFLQRCQERLQHLSDDSSRRDETLRILGIVADRRHEGIHHREIMNMLKKQYAKGEIKIDPELFGEQSKKKGGLRGWDSVLETELWDVAFFGDVWDRLEVIPGIHREDYSSFIFKGVQDFPFFLVDRDEALAPLFSSQEFDERGAQINEICKIRALLANTSFASPLKKPLMGINPKTAIKMKSLFNNRHGLASLDGILKWYLPFDAAEKIVHELEEIVRNQNPQMELF